MDQPRPRFSIVSAVYNVARYLPAYIASIEDQDFDLSRIEVVAVDDGSTDDSLSILRAWAERRPGLVTVVTKSNGGQGSARNLGLEHATGEWVTFTDPDDTINRGFFTALDRFSTAHPDVEVLSFHPISHYEATNQLVDDHPRRWQFEHGPRAVDLDREPEVFTGGAPVGAFRLDRIRAIGLRFDPRIRPTFEDGHFAMVYVLSLDRPIIGVVPGARYLYRKRADGTSTLQQSWRDPGRLTDVVEFGHLDILERSRRPDGKVPPWVQHLLVYELSWYLAVDGRVSSIVRVPPETFVRFHELMERILPQLDPKIIAAHRIRKMSSIWVDILAHGYRAEPWHGDRAARTRVDRAMGLQRIAYRYIGPPPRERFLVDGAEVTPAFGKVMTHLFFGRVVMLERIAWLPLGEVRVELDGRAVRLIDGWPAGRYRGRPTSKLAFIPYYARRIGPTLARSVMSRVSRWGLLALGLPVRAISRLPPYGTRYRDAWVLLDRVYNADDNGERLFEYLRAERTDINAWFTIEKGTADWRRLRAARTERVVATGSWSWLMLMLNCSWILSSHADVAVLRPPRVMQFLQRATWRIAFLQHGVMKDDLSRWFNRKEFDVFVVSTNDELASVVDDGTPYEYTHKEVRLTGLPRFDRLLTQGRRVQPADRDLIVVAPTWRTQLTIPLQIGSERRAIDDAFWTSEYFRSWMGLLTDDRLLAAARAKGWRVAFMPHPNLQPILPQIDLPGGVEALTFEGNDVQAIYARCALLVTDYSSVAFNVAYLDGPVVYYQFDREVEAESIHIGRPGYFDYERDGFGPVATDPDGVIAAIERSVAHGPRPAPEYQARIDATFPIRDGNACRRVVAAVEEMDRPYGRPSPVARAVDASTGG